ncbi:MAG TPA: DUF5916 domain-containing protein [Bacteroidales bacterium]|nr:DUF5916 domain-containing protein [Bacteroidales bacterium]
MEKGLRSLLCAFILITGTNLFSQPPDSLIPFDQAYKRSYYTTRIQSAVPVIDGKLDDACWANDGKWSQNFIQNTPVERGIPTYPTRIKILFDDKNIYFALRAWDPEPGKINRFVNNRDDNSVGDLISVAFDTYHDYRAATEFNINAGGNKTDLIVTDNLSVNLNWNAVWEGKTDINDSSWTAEYRIPLNQLRYNHSDTGMVWGLHVRRIIRRTQEVDQWSLIPRKNSGHVYSFGTMYGLKGVQKPRLVEFLPYASAKITTEPGIAGSPYATGSRWNGNAGIDAKLGIGDFTMDITVNPDFGQIEADPSVMNLTAFETFYEEKRPFFLEGKHIFDFTADQNLMFYSRRIGHAPSWQPGADNINSFQKVPEFTNIINAVKLSGTTRNGVSIGIMQSTTQEERARYTNNDIETRPAVEPLTSYVVGRLQKVADKGNTQAGVMFTSVNRFINDVQLEILNKNAFVGGIDFLKYMRNREYFIDFKGMVSHITGEQSAMMALQRNALHYFQRPDALNYLGVDSTIRSLTGSGGYISAGRQGNKKFIFSERVSWSSPGFDLNDAGYLYMADIVLNSTKLAFRQTDPGKIFRNYTLTMGQMNGWNYGGRTTYNDLNVQFVSVFHNRWELSFQETYVLSELGTRMLRGGPAFRLSPYWKSVLIFNTDKSKRVMFRIQNTSLISTDGITRSNIAEPSLTFRVGNHFYIYGEFEYQFNSDNYQYVTTLPDEEDFQYIMARIRQNTYNFTLRVNYNITPDISIQYYGSPFMSSGRYNDFKYALNAASKNEEDKTAPYASTGLNPDFSFREFRSNLVARWEYRPGSTIYLVWSNRRQNRENAYHPSLGHNLSQMFDTDPVNIFMVKMSFWLGL